MRTLLLFQNCYYFHAIYLRVRIIDYRINDRSRFHHRLFVAKLEACINYIVHEFTLPVSKILRGLSNQRDSCLANLGHNYSLVRRCCPTISQLEAVQPTPFSIAESRATHL